MKYPRLPWPRRPTWAASLPVTPGKLLFDELSGKGESSGKMPTEREDATTRTPLTTTRTITYEECIRLFVVSKNAFSSTSNQSLHRRLFVVPSFLQRAPAVEQSSLAQTLPCFAPSCPKHRPNRQSETRQRPWAMLGRTCAQHDVSRGLETSVSGGDITCDREIASKSICGNYSRRASRNISSTSASP